MADATKIEWAEASVNPIRARSRTTDKLGWYCSHASPGCDHCYSETLNRRLGTRVDYRAQDRDKVELFLNEKILEQPLRWKRGRRIFWNSMTDTFGEFVPDEWIDRIMAIAALTPQHQHLFLTKRAERMREWMQGRGGFIRPLAKSGSATVADQMCPLHWPLPNVWLGVSVEDQRRADERIPELLETPAAVRWLSIEPMLEAINIDHYLRAASHRFVGPILRGAIQWTVIGGESGPGARPFNIAWARSIVSQCHAANVSCFVKQLGAYPVTFDRIGPKHPYAPNTLQLRHSKGGDISEFPPDLRVREYPNA